ncbi:DEK C terminal domain [Musa troglodytarum]|uniref:DEK C terminal domain n=1 Tax=Musa troglodytarum TaxID=320322 RepID=A0A9E7JUQ6_9LILI|nr:DEK C terminal domain [Musa troglodytarum]
MTGEGTATDAEGATASNIGNPQLEDKSVIRDTAREDEQTDVDEKKEAKEMDIDGQEKSKGKKDVTEDDHVLEQGGEEDTKNVNTVEPGDVKMADAEDVKDEEKGGKTVGQGVQDANENDVNQDEDVGTTEKKVNEHKGGDGSKKKWSGPKKRLDKDGETKARKLLASPVSSIERPVRERKTVERLVEVIEKEPNKEFQVEKGRGTPLKDIPNGSRTSGDSTSTFV